MGALCFSALSSLAAILPSSRGSPNPNPKAMPISHPGSSSLWLPGCVALPEEQRAALILPCPVFNLCEYLPWTLPVRSRVTGLFTHKAISNQISYPFSQQIISFILYKKVKAQQSGLFYLDIRPFTLSLQSTFKHAQFKKILYMTFVTHSLTSLPNPNNASDPIRPLRAHVLPGGVLNCSLVLSNPSCLASNARLMLQC